VATASSSGAIAVIKSSVVALRASSSITPSATQLPNISAPRLHSTSRSMRVAITSVHPGCALHPVHPGCTSGYGEETPGMVAAARFGLCAPFPPRPPPKAAGAGPQTPARAAKSEIAIAGWRSMVPSMANFAMTFEPGWRSRSTSFPVNGAAWSCLSCLSPLSHRVLIHFR
jgi:hypothetical protein